MKKHLVIIINPNSGTNRDKPIEKALNKYLDTEKYTYELKYTKYAGHGTLIAKEAAINNAFAVVVVGGDGSINDVLQGIINTNAHLALIPQGSGNGLAQSLKISKNINKAISIINNGELKPIDVLQVNNRYALSNVGIGFDAEVCKKFVNSKKRGFLSYLYIIISSLISYKEQEYLIKMDNLPGLKRKCFFINIANGPIMGYQFTIAHKALFDDGLMNITIINKFPKLLAPLLALRMILGNINKSKYIEADIVSKVSIEGLNNAIIQIHIDGEYIQQSLKRVDIIINHKHLNIITPQTVNVY